MKTPKINKGALLRNGLIALGVTWGVITLHNCSKNDFNAYPQQTVGSEPTPNPLNAISNEIEYYTTITLPYGGELIVTQIIGNDGGVYKYAEVNGPNLQIDYSASPASPDQSDQSSIGFLLPMGATTQEGTTPLTPGTVITVNEEKVNIYVPQLN